MITRRGDLRFKINNDSVYVTYRNQVVVFNSYNSDSWHSFRRFRDGLSEDKSSRYDSMNDVYRLAIKNGVRGVGSSIIIHKRVGY